MHRKLGLAVILCLILSLLSGCGTPPAPEPAEGAELPDLVSSRAERWSTAEDMETGYSLPGLNEQNASGLGQEPTAITWPSELPSGPAPSSGEAQTGNGPLDEPAGTVPPPETDPDSEPQTQPGDGQQPGGPSRFADGAHGGGLPAGAAPDKRDGRSGRDLVRLCEASRHRRDRLHPR